MRMRVEVIHRPRYFGRQFFLPRHNQNCNLLCVLGETTTMTVPTQKERGSVVSVRASKSKANEENESMDIPWISLQEDAVSHIPPVLTRDGSYLFLVQDSSVLIVSRITNRVVATLSDVTMSEELRHTAPITGMMLSLFNPLQLITCSLDGTVKVWDYLESQLHDNVHVGHPIVSMSASSHWRNRLFVAVSKHGQQAAGPSSDSKTKEASSTIYSVQLGRGLSRAHKAAKIVRLGKMRPVSHLALSPDGRWLVATSSAKLHVLDLNDTGAGFTKYSTESRFTSLAFHPSKDLVQFATGEMNGKVKLWHCLEPPATTSAKLVPSMVSSGSLEPISPTTTLHWHAHAVAALQYTPDGAQLLSGGEEGVLVLWKLLSGTAAGSDGREFVPRLGASIMSLAVASGYENSEQEYVAHLADGSVVFIASLSLKPTRVFSTIKCDATRALLPLHECAKLPQPLALDRAAGQLVLLAGHPSTVQFVDVATRTHVRDMEIVPSNRVSRPEEALLTPPSVYAVAFSDPGRDALHAEWMATVDGRDGGSFTSEFSLKLWQWEPRSKTYVLNTRIDHPHEKSVSSIGFSPCLSDNDPLQAFLLVTAGGDGQVKTWRLALRSLKGARSEHFWVCRSSFGYRESVPHHVSWAPDGSLFAVAQGLFVTIWDPQTLVMQARLATPEIKDVRTCDFVGRKGRFLAVTGSPSRFVIWDLISQSVVYSASGSFYAQVKHGDRVLALRSTHAGTAIDLVCPRDRRIVRTYMVPFLLHDAPVNASRSSSLDDLALYGVRQHGALVGIGAAVTAVATHPRSHAAMSLHSVALSDARSTLFDELFGVADSEEKKTESVLLSDAQYKQQLASDAPASAVLELFATPPHMLPPMSTLLDPFVDALLPPRSSTSAVTSEAVAPHLTGGSSTALGTAPSSAADHAHPTDASFAIGSDVVPDGHEVPTRLDALDHVAQARDMDISHLTAVFDQLMSTATSATTVPVSSLPSRAPKSGTGASGKRRTSRSVSS